MIDGALLLDKPRGLTSNAALQKAKRLLGAAKAGHAGTLDPLATGLLVLLFGEATKFSGPALEADKEYLATLSLGTRTSTGDAEGEVVESKEVRVDSAQVHAVLRRFTGEIEQVPPMHSALKRDGVPLYRLARRGETVERAPRKVFIRAIEALSMLDNCVEIRVLCSKGTYVRTLAEDIGLALGTVAHLAALRRTGSGEFRVERACTLESLEATDGKERRGRLLPLAALLAGLPRAELDTQDEARLRQGQAVKLAARLEGVCGVYGPGGVVVGLGTAGSDGILRPLRLTQSAEKHR